MGPHLASASHHPSIHRHAKMAAQQYHRSDNAEVYRTNASFVYSNAFTAAVVKLLDPRPGDHVIDLGCGMLPTLPHCSYCLSLTTIYRLQEAES